MNVKDGLLRRLARISVLPASVGKVTSIFPGIRSAVFLPEAIEEVLESPVVKVPYGPKGALLDVGKFPLSLDGPEHDVARAKIGEVLGASATAHAAGVAVALEVAVAAVRDAEDQIDLVADLIDPALQHWCEVWFGLEGEGVLLQRIARVTMHAMFLNPELPKFPCDVPGLLRCADLVAEARLRWEPMLEQAPRRTVARELFDRFGAEEGTAQLVGLTVGPLALGSKSLVTVASSLLTDGRLGELDTPETAIAEFRRVMATSPPLPGLPRVAESPVQLFRGQGVVPPGLFFAATLVAAAAPSQADDPARWAFGSGPHECMGRTHIEAIAGAILPPLSERKPLPIPGSLGQARDGAGPAGVQKWPFTGHLLGQFSA